MLYCSICVCVVVITTTNIHRVSIDSYDEEKYNKIVVS